MYEQYFHSQTIFTLKVSSIFILKLFSPSRYEQYFHYFYHQLPFPHTSNVYDVFRRFFLDLFWQKTMPKNSIFFVWLVLGDVLPFFQLFAILNYYCRNPKVLGLIKKFGVDFYPESAPNSPFVRKFL